MNSPQSAFDQASPDETSGLARRLEAGAWAVFFIWAGISMLAGVPWGWFFVGVGVLTLVAQFARRQMDMKIEGFWVACGTVFLASGVWELLAIPWSLAPVLLILLGVVLFWKAVWR
jgi:hypothetical protein